jgi:hypothetical protein
VVEIAVQTDDIQTVVRNVHHSASRDKQRSDGFRELGWESIQFVLSDADISKVGVLCDRVEWVLTLGDVTHGEDADAMYSRWLKPAIAVPENTMEEASALHMQIVA